MSFSALYTLSLHDALPISGQQEEHLAVRIGDLVQQDLGCLVVVEVIQSQRDLGASSGVVVDLVHVQPPHDPAGQGVEQMVVDQVLGAAGVAEGSDRKSVV